MGWFLKSTACGRRTKQCCPPRFHWRDPQRAIIPLKVLLVALAAVLTMTGWRFAHQFLLKHAESHIPASLTAQQVHLADVPTWMDALTRKQLQRLAAVQTDSPSLDGHQLHSVADALRRNPWVEQIHKVRRIRGGIVIHAEFRRPIALVEGPDAYHRVDQQGVRLPGMFVMPQPKALQMPVIVGVRSPPAGCGEVWPGEDLAGALTVVRVLSGHHFGNQIRVIDARHRDGQGRTRLTLIARYVMVHWGLAPGQGGPIERDIATKLSRLSRVLRAQRSIAEGGPRPVVEIYGPTILVRRTPDRSDQPHPTGHIMRSR